MLNGSEIDENGGIETRVGTITSIATATIPSGAYATWLSGEGLSEGDADRANASGIPYRLLFAFDLPADSGALPISTVESGGGPRVSIVLPAGGLNAGLSAEYRASLFSGTWGALPTGNYVNGSDSLDAGKTGTVELSHPVGTEGFIRLVADQ